MIRLFFTFIYIMLLATTKTTQQLYQEQSFKFAKSVYHFKLLENGNNTTNKPIVLGRLGLIRLNGSTPIIVDTSSLDQITHNNNLAISLNSSSSNFLIDESTLEIRTSPSFNVEPLQPPLLSPNSRHRGSSQVSIAYQQYESYAYLVHKNTMNSPQQHLIDKCLIIVQVISDDKSEKIDSPKFALDPYEVQMCENNGPETFLVRVEAERKGFETNEDLLSYHLVVGNNSESNSKYSSPLFQIKSDTGEIFAKRALNREQRDEYVLNVVAVEKKSGGRRVVSASTRVVVRVLAAGENDESRPRFERDVYNVSMAENVDFTKRPVVLTVKAFGRENLTSPTTAPTIIYSLSGNLNDLNTFEIDAQTGAIHLVSKLNYDLKSHYKLSLIAHDQTQQPACASYAQLNIAIEDVNMQAPIFTQPFYEFVFMESALEAAATSVVGRVRALETNGRRQQQQQQQQNNNMTGGKIEYSIELKNSNVAEIPFGVDPKNGTIFAKKQVLKSAKSVYEFYVTARDIRQKSGDSNRLSSTVKVKVRILDMNDNVPEFAKKFYHLNISEDTTMGLPLLQLLVINRDPNSLLDFSIDTNDMYDSSSSMEHPFSLVRQSNNLVFLTLDRGYLSYKKKATYSLRVRVVDQLDGLYSTSSVEICVQPNNNFRPRFDKDIYRFEVWENTTVGSLIGRVEALASDQLVVYKLVSTNLGELSSQLTALAQQTTNSDDARSILPDHSNFRLNELTGQLYLSSPLDRELYDQITLYVSATYRGDTTTQTSNNPSRSDHAIVQIKILDANDNAPQFTRTQYTTTIYPNTPAHSFLFRVEAIDKDAAQNGLVSYSIVESEWSRYFRIDAKTGIVKLNSPIDFNNERTTTEIINLTIRAKDAAEGEFELSSTTGAIVRLNFAAKLAPKCDSHPFHFEVLSGETKIGLIRARDPDLGVHADISYKLLNGNDIFELKPSGIFNTVTLAVKSNSYLIRSKLYRMSIRAYSTEAAALYTDCDVEAVVKGLNESYFSVSKRFKLIFNNYKNYFLTEQIARVPIDDGGIGMELKYSLSDSVGRQFVNLNELTGEIVLKPLLNSNNQINASFDIEISDNEHRVKTTCELIVSMVTDNLIAESVTITIFNVDLELFLNSMYELFVESVLRAFPKFKKSNVHIFNLDNSSTAGLNLSLAISYDYEKDLFMPSQLLKQTLHANIDQIEQALDAPHISIYSDSSSCSIEPCLNYQQCLAQTKFLAASATYASTRSVQFRSIHVHHDFSCSCPLGFTGTNISVTCDLEINLCYSNPCQSRGVCVSVESGYVCVCDAGWTGKACEFNLDEAKCCDLAIANLVSSTPEQILSDKITKRKAALLSPSSNTNTSSTGQFSLSTNSLQCIPTTHRSPIHSSDICQGPSQCKNLILGGSTCDQCDLTLNPTTRSFTTAYCQLRARYFPPDLISYMALAGIKSRFRFSLSLALSSIKSNSYVFYQQRLDEGKDFLAVRIVDDKLVVEYSLGEESVTQFSLNALSVTDGRWRQLRLDYSGRKFKLAVDNDGLDEVNACELARNMNETNGPECFRVEHDVKLPIKCHNQIETCFRYFDFNGPLIFGKSPRNHPFDQSLAYEGCLADIFINEHISNLREDLLAETNTQMGCPPKQDQCKLKSDILRAQCLKCSHTWSTSMRCECRQGDDYEFLGAELYCALRKPDQVVTIAENGYLLLDERHMYAQNDDIQLEFSVKMRQTNPTIVNTTLLNMKFVNLITDIGVKLIYNWNSNELTLVGDSLGIKIRKYKLLDEEYWTKIEIKMAKNGQIKVSVNGLFHAETYSSLIGVLFGQNNLNLKWSIQAPGCVRGIRLFNEPNFSYKGVNTFKGCTSLSRSDLNTQHPCLSQLHSRSIYLEPSKFANPQCTDHELRQELCTSVCYNSGKCSIAHHHTDLDPSVLKLNCSCPQGYKGRYCEHVETKSSSSAKLLDDGAGGGSSNCPAKWWGREESGICGPCECDESKNFSPDCNKTTGQCYCKSKFYKRVNEQTGEEHCVPCDCSLEGSTSLQCSPQTGQCPCLIGAGITGRRCDQCVSPLAEMTTTMTSSSSSTTTCRQLTTQQCPQARYLQVWWPRSSFHKRANSTCPRGSVGTAFRTCGDSRWLHDVDLSECQSTKLIDSQLLRLCVELEMDKSDLNSYQAIKLVEDLSRIVGEDMGDLGDEDDGYFGGVVVGGEEEEDVAVTARMMGLSVTENSLYALDLLVIRNLSIAVLEYEAKNAPSFLFIQDKNFLANLFGVLNQLLNKKYDLKLNQLVNSRQEIDGFVGARTIKLGGIYTDLLISMHNYLQSILKYDQNYASGGNEKSTIEFEYPNLQFYTKTLESAPNANFYSASIQSSLKFKLYFTPEPNLSKSSSTSSSKLAFISLNSASTNLPNSLLVEQQQQQQNQQFSNMAGKKVKRTSLSSSTWLISSFKYRVVSNVFMFSQETTTTITTSINDVNGEHLVVEFFLSNNFDTIYDAKHNSIQYRQLKTVKSDYSCVSMNLKLRTWTMRGARVIAYDPIGNVVKCAYDLRLMRSGGDGGEGGIFAVITPQGTFAGNNSAPINFSIVFRVLMPLALGLLIFTMFILVLFRKIRTHLSIIYANLCLNTFLLHSLFYFGVNSNKSQISCKLIAICQHYFTLAAYLWYLIIALHLYRMLTELRDINSTPRFPIIYYLIGYLLPLISVGLTLGLKQDLYTNYDATLSIILYPMARLHDMSSVFCWLNVNQQAEILYSYLAPILVILVLFLALLAFSYRELKLNTFKQTDVKLVNQSIVASLALLPIKCGVTLFLLMFLSTSSSVTQTSSSYWTEASVYEACYLVFVLAFAVMMFALFVLMNRQVKESLVKLWQKGSSRIVGRYSEKDEEELRRKSAVKAKMEYRNEPFGGFIGIGKKLPPEFVDVGEINSKKFMSNPKYIIDYNEFQTNNTNSISTTTTSGTLENSDDLNSQNLMLMGVSNPNMLSTTTNPCNNNNNNNYHLANLINTTNTESTTNESSGDFNTYQYDFGRSLVNHHHNHQQQQQHHQTSSSSEIAAECDVVDVAKVLKSRNMYLENNIHKSDELQLSAAKYNCQKRLFEQQENGGITRPIGLFWPNAVANCDTSFLDVTSDSAAYNTPSKMHQYAMNRNKISGIPDLVSCSAASNNNNQINNNNHMIVVHNNNNSYNSSSSPPNSNSFSTSNSSLGNGPIPNGMGSYNVATSKAVNLEFIQTTLNQNSPIVPLFSGNLITGGEIDNETRV